VWSQDITPTSDRIPGPHGVRL